MGAEILHTRILLHRDMLSGVVVVAVPKYMLSGTLRDPDEEPCVLLVIRREYSCLVDDPSLCHLHLISCVKCLRNRILQIVSTIQQRLKCLKMEDAISVCSVRSSVTRNEVNHISLHYIANTGLLAQHTHDQKVTFHTSFIVLHPLQHQDGVIFLRSFKLCMKLCHLFSGKTIFLWSKVELKLAKRGGDKMMMNDDQCFSPLSRSWVISLR